MQVILGQVSFVTYPILRAREKRLTLLRLTDKRGRCKLVSSRRCANCQCVVCISILCQCMLWINVMLHTYNMHDKWSGCVLRVEAIWKATLRSRSWPITDLGYNRYKKIPKAMLQNPLNWENNNEISNQIQKLSAVPTCWWKKKSKLTMTI